MIGKGQDKKINKDGSGMTHREMNWFKSCGRGLNGQFPQTVLVDTKEMKISTGHQLDEFSTIPLRALVFAMDSIVKNQLKNRIEDVAEIMGKCGSHHCDGCGLCEIDEDIEENDDWFVCTECWD